METDSGHRAMVRCREGARGRRERCLGLRLGSGSSCVVTRCGSPRIGGEGWQSKTSVGVQTARGEESDEENYAKGQKTSPPPPPYEHMHDRVYFKCTHHIQQEQQLTRVCVLHCRTPLERTRDQSTLHLPHLDETCPLRTITYLCCFLWFNRGPSCA